MSTGKRKISHFFTSAARRTDESPPIAAPPARNEPNDVIVIDDDDEDRTDNAADESDNDEPIIINPPIRKPLTHEEDHECMDPSPSESEMPTESPNNAPKTKKVNPFAKFAAPTKPRKRANPFAHFAASSSSSSLPLPQPSKPKKSALNPTSNKKSKSTEYVKMRDLDRSEQERVVKKWHSLIQHDRLCPRDAENSESKASYSLEDKRFHVLVAARIHARCKEAAVVQAMRCLNETMPITVEHIATADTDDIASSIKNLQFYSVKAKQLQTAARQLQSSYQSKVPEDEENLKKIMGIGPVLADLLAFVNTRERHKDLGLDEQVEA